MVDAVEVTPDVEYSLFQIVQIPELEAVVVTADDMDAVVLTYSIFHDGHGSVIIVAVVVPDPTSWR